MPPALRITAGKATAAVCDSRLLVPVEKRRRDQLSQPDPQSSPPKPKIIVLEDRKELREGQYYGQLGLS
jgi:hypothetical protein